MEEFIVTGGLHQLVAHLLHPNLYLRSQVVEVITAITSAQVGESAFVFECAIWLCVSFHATIAPERMPNSWFQVDTHGAKPLFVSAFTGF